MKPKHQPEFCVKSGHFLAKNGRITPRFTKKKIEEIPKSVLLLGPRQVAKTTAMLTFSSDLVINLAAESEDRSILTSPDELRERIELNQAKLVFINEIQRIPELMNTIEMVIV